MTDADLSVALDAHVARALAAFPDDGLAHPGAAAALRPVAVASDFAIGVLQRRPDLLQRLFDEPDAPPLTPPVLDPDARDAWPMLLRRYRAAESARLVWRDVHGLDDVDATLAGSTRLAETCLQVSLAALSRDFARRHGVVYAPMSSGVPGAGAPVGLVVFALGKLGGGELNFSSDIDIVYGYEHGGESRAQDAAAAIAHAADAADAPRAVRPLAAEDYFARLGQALAKLLDEVTADGFCHRVDLRLRPFGNAGRVALSFDAMEQYFQREGRDWERYAWQKARPVAGDIAAGERLLVTLRPFVYRRYLDYGALDGLRMMKAAIAAEVARQDLGDDIKRGHGGIREIEFLAQALQLIRGGRDASLRERRLVPALTALCRARQVTPEATAALVDAYRFLRRVENRLQMLADQQTHVLPSQPAARLRLARGLGLPDWQTLVDAMAPHRALVAGEFGALLAARDEAPAVSGDLAGYWRALPDGGDAGTLATAGFADAALVDTALRDFSRAPSVRDLSDAARARLDRVMPVLLQASAPADRPLMAIRRLLALLHNVLRRASYLALLDEQPQALARLIDLVTRSAFLAERVALHPLLLDELLDARVEGPLPDAALAQAACTAAAARGDVESALYALNEVRQSISFRIVLATLDARATAVDATRRLAWLADAVVGAVLVLAQREMLSAHGAMPGARFAALGYGSLGGIELGVGSDLDLVFLYTAPEGAVSDGLRPLEPARWFARVAQKVVTLLGTETGAGRLYEVDTRLRPDGASGLLVSTLASYDDYQRQRAWTWEHQALVRARCVAGDAALAAAFEDVRRAALARPRAAAALRGDVAAMRVRMRDALDRSRAGGFDLKQGRGGLVDLEFVVQQLVLAHAGPVPALLAPRATPALLAALEDAGVLASGTVQDLVAAHATLVARALGCTLDRRPRLVAPDADVTAAREAIATAALAHGVIGAEADAAAATAVDVDAGDLRGAAGP